MTFSEKKIVDEPRKGTDDEVRESVEEGTQSDQKSAGTQRGTVFGRRFSEEEQKTLFLYLVVGIVLLELAITVGALVFSIVNAQPSAEGIPHFRFPWIGYLVSAVMVPVLVMLLVNLVQLGVSRDADGGGEQLEGVPQRVRTFYALVRGAPSVILFGGFVIMGAALYYFDGVMVFLLKIGDAFEVVAVWVVGGFAAAWTITYSVRGWLQYKTRQMQAEYAFRQEVLERTGMVILDTRHAPTTELRMLPSAGSPPPPPAERSLPPAAEDIVDVETSSDADSPHEERTRDSGN